MNEGWAWGGGPREEAPGSVTLSKQCNVAGSRAAFSWSQACEADVTRVVSGPGDMS